MSFSKDVKNELVKSETSGCCALAELSAILRTAGSVALSQGGFHIEISSETESLKDRVDQLISLLYGQKALMMPVEENIGKRYFSFSISKAVSAEILTDCGIMEYDNETGLILNEGIDKYLFLGECCKRAYVRGAYLGSGSINVPSESNKGGFALEISHQSEVFIDDLRSLLSELSFETGKIRRGAKYALYIKRKESICDFLALIGASSAVLHLMDVIIMREIRGDANRSANCIGANIAKSTDYGVKQAKLFESMKKQGLLSKLPVKLQQAAQLRMEFPEMPIEQLAEMLAISKSGMKHRFDRIEKFFSESGDTGNVDKRS